MNNDELHKLKHRISARLLANEGVSGVGTPGGKLAIYLTEDSGTVRDEVAQVLQAEAPDTPVDYIVIGRLRAQGQNGRRSTKLAGGPSRLRHRQQ